jgi:hypothetical protein
MSNAIKTHEPQEIDIPVSSEVMGVMAELTLPARVEAVAERVAALKPKVAQAVESNLKEATKTVANDARCTDLRQAGQRLREIHLEYQRERAAREPGIMQDRRLSDEGKQAELQKLADARDARLADLEREIGMRARVARIWYSRPQPPQLSQTAVAQGTMFANLFPHVPADVALQDIAEWLESATDADVSDAARADAFALLYHVGRPLLARRALTPEKHAEPFQRAYQDLANAVESLTENWGERPHRRIAMAVADMADANFRYVLSMAATHGWDASIEDATRDFFIW